MAQMHGRNLFTGVEYVKGFFLFDMAPVFEIEHPFRKCKHALYVRIWFNRALVLGWWRQGDEVSNLLMAVRGNKINVEDEKARFYRAAMGERLLESPEEDSEDDGYGAGKLG